MYLLFVGLIVVAALLMCFVVMIQNSKGGGLASSFASSNQIMGVRKTTDFIEKLTWGLAAFMVVVSIACAYVLPSTQAGGSVTSCERKRNKSVERSCWFRGTFYRCCSC